LRKFITGNAKTKTAKHWRFAMASIPLGDVFTNPAHLGGLPPFGANVIKECNRLGILVDFSYANTEAVATALKLSASRDQIPYRAG
jgi:hypothetical protein